MATVPVNPAVLQWAIDRSGMSWDTLLEKVPELQLWVDGIKDPSFKQLEKFAKTTMAPFGSLFLPEPPEAPPLPPDFRTKNNTAPRSFSPNLLDTIHVVRQRQAWMRDWLMEDGADPVPFVGSGAGDPRRHTKSGRNQIADQIRQELKLEPDWSWRLRNWDVATVALRKAMENIGILVFSTSVVGANNKRRLDPDEFRGFVLCDDYVPAVFINDADTRSAQIFTLAHELVHVWFGQDGVFNLDQLRPASTAIEKICNEIAAQFLVPEKLLRTHWNEQSATRDGIRSLASMFKVSPLVIARRGLDLGLLSRDDFSSFYEESREEWTRLRLGRKGRSGGNFYATQRRRLGLRFSAALVRAVREDRILYRDAFRLTGMRGNTFQKFADKTLESLRGKRG
ncbi:MAG: DNA-binding protein [Planctomyces sp.]|nr:DNA-binding protein [Planctomyces sp.]